MQKNRSVLIELLTKLKQRYMSIEKYLLSLLSDQSEYDRIVAHYGHVIAELKKELKNQPIGYRYTGVYYLKKSSPLPVEYIKILVHSICERIWSLGKLKKNLVSVNFLIIEQYIQRLKEWSLQEKMLSLFIKI